MKRPFVLLRLVLILSPGFTSISYGQGQAESQTGPASIWYQPEQGNYTVVRYVIGSGGVWGAIGANYFHAGTAGQTSVGGMQGANNRLLSGFWLPAGYGPTAVDQKETAEAGYLPTTFELHQNYSNPFRVETTIRYDLPKTCRVRVEVFNVVGQRMRLLGSGIQGPASMQVVWDGRNEQGEMVGSGIYLYRLTAYSANAGESSARILFHEIKKMLLVK